ncbi:MAG TPA: HIT family protein [Gemmatimonadales bacterium]|jgi:histidine triad (HIT) family protein
MTLECVFCRIVTGQEPASRVYEDDLAVAFLDLYPVHAGHTLVVPRRHLSDLRECDGALAAHLFAVSARLAPGVTRAMGADGFNIWTAAGRAAGQTVFHLHLHVLPRFHRDGFGPRLAMDGAVAAARSELDRVAARILAAR